MRKTHLLIHFALYCLSLLLAPMLSPAATLQAKIDRQVIQSNESVNLQITLDEQSQAQPDFSVLYEDFDILSQSQGHHIKVINGVTTAQTQWHLQLIPQKTGKLKIPAIPVGNHHTQALTLEVNKPSASANTQTDAQQPIFVEVSVDQNQPYVQSQVIYTTKIFIESQIAHRLQNLDLTPPQAADAVIKRLGDSIGYSTQRDERNYQVAEVRYAVFPQSSGEITLAPPVLKGAKLLSPYFRDPISGAAAHAQTFSVEGTPLQLQVQAPPKTIGNDLWLPAQQLSLQENWSSKLQNIQVGEPITRTIMMQAKGLTAAQLPDIPEQNNAQLSTYPDQAKLNDALAEDGVTGVKTQKIAYVPTTPGKLTLPAIELTWWNTEKNRLDRLTLPSHTIEVQPALAAIDANSTAQTNLIIANDAVPELNSATNPQHYPVWAWVLNIALISGWLLTVLYQRRKSAAVTTTATTLHTAQLGDIKKACLQKRWPELKSALLQWAKTQWPQQHILSLGQLAQQVTSTELKNLLQQLDQLFYADQSPTAFDGKIFWQSFKAYTKTLHKSKMGKRNPLPSLYPSS
jgi:hypothetical protein